MVNRALRRERLSAKPDRSAGGNVAASANSECSAVQFQPGCGGTIHPLIKQQQQW